MTINHKRWLQALAIASGGAALLYELGLERVLELRLGASSYAITAILTSFFLGLALGAWLARRLLGRRSLLKTYAAAEVTTAAAAWLALILFSSGTSLLTPDFSRFDPLKLLLAIAVLLPPMVAMGATLPLIVQAYRQTGPGGSFAGLYGLNTLGGALAITLATAWLFPRLGTHLMLAAAAALNLAAAAAAWRLAPGFKQAKVPPLAKRPSGNSLALAAYSGFAAIGFEILAIRLTILQVGSSVYALAFVTLAVLAGIVAGSFLVNRTPGKLRFLLKSLVAAAAILVITYFAYPALTHLTSSLSQHTSNVWLTSAILALIISFPASAAIGAVLPALAHSDQEKEAGHRAAWLVGANTLGAAIAPAVFTFWLIPWIGLKGAFLVIAVSLSAAAVSRLNIRGSFRLAGAAAVGIVAIILAAAYGWEPQVLSAGPLIYQKPANSEAPLVFHKQGRLAYVTVNQLENDIILRINGKIDAGTTLDLDTEYLMGHLPSLFTDSRDNALVIGVGSGITTGAITRYPYKSITVSEVEPAVVDASKYFFQYNNSYWRDPRVNITYSSAQNLLASRDTKYSVIASEPTNTWITGVGSLFTKEFLATAKNRLDSGGVMLQWLNAYDISAADLKDVLHTFQSVFPNTYVFSMPVSNDILLAGTSRPVNIDSARLNNWFDFAKEDLYAADITSTKELSATYAFGPEQVRRFTSGSALLSIDKPTLEYDSPLTILKNTLPQMDALMIKWHRPAAQLGPAFQEPGFADYSRAFTLFKQALIDSPSHSIGSLQKAAADLEAATAIYPHPYYVQQLLSVDIDLAKDAYARRDRNAYDSYVSKIIQIDPGQKGSLPAL